MCSRGRVACWIRGGGGRASTYGARSYRRILKAEVAFLMEFFYYYLKEFLKDSGAISCKQEVRSAREGMNIHI